MKKLVRSTLSDKHCYKCDSLLASGTIRYVNGGMHECAVCPTKPDEDDLFWEWLINKVGE